MTELDSGSFADFTAFSAVIEALRKAHQEELDRLRGREQTDSAVVSECK